jgi:hypothetical protein
MLWASPKMKSTAKRYILAVFASLYKHTYSIYRTINSPDVDIDKFTDLLMASIAELKKQPKLCRCLSAFRRIEQSVELLKDKFTDYYRESISTGNENALISSFIVDVSNQGGADARLTREFRTIIQYMHEISQKTGKNKDPNVQRIMKMLNDNHSLMERHTGVSRKSADEETKDLSELDLTIKTDEVTLLPEEIAEEKRVKRLEKQKAKAKKKRAKAKTGRGKNNKIGEHRKHADENAEETVDAADENEDESKTVEDTVEQSEDSKEQLKETIDQDFEEKSLEDLVMENLKMD